MNSKEQKEAPGDSDDVICLRSGSLQPLRESHFDIGGLKPHLKPRYVELTRSKKDCKIRNRDEGRRQERTWHP